MAKQINDPIIPHRPMTIAEIRQLQATIREAELSLQNEGHANFKAMIAGAPPPRPLTDHERRVAGRVQSMMNGATPPRFLEPAITRDDQIRADVEAFRIVSRELSKQEDDARQREAEQFVSDNDKKWRALCKEIILAAARLAALEERARVMLTPIEGRVVGGVAMGSTIGSGFSLLGVGDPLLDMRNDALKQGVVTTAEIRKAQNVE